MNCDCFCHATQLMIDSMAGGGCVICCGVHAGTPNEETRDAHGNLYVNGQPVGTTIVHTTTYGEELADQAPVTVTVANSNLSLQLTRAEADRLLNVLDKKSPRTRAVNEIAELAERHDAGEIDDDSYAARVQELLAS